MGHNSSDEDNNKNSSTRPIEDDINNNNNNNNNNNKKKKKVRYQDEEKKSLATNYSDSSDEEYNNQEDQENYESVSLDKNNNNTDGGEEEEEETGIILQPIVRDPSTYRPQSLYSSNDEIREGDSISAKISKTIGKTNKKIKQKIGESNKKIEQRVKTSNKAIEGKLQEGWDTVAGVAMKPVDSIREQHHRRVEKHEVEERAGWFKDKLNIQKFECLDYVTIYNKAYRLELYKNFNKLVSDNEWLRWIVSLFMGISIGIIAYISHAAVSNINRYKFKYVEKVVELDLFLGFLVYFLANSLLATCSSLLAVYYEPTAAGSGIPEVKGYLNGTKIPHALKMKTLWTKLSSMILAVSSGLQVGSEGPMIHIGAIVGNGFSQAQSKEFGFKIPFLRSFRNDKDKRDFVTSGAGAGVAAAFGAPLGGALFSMEEVASFWSTTLTWRCFFSCLVATFVMNILQSNSGNISGLIIFNTGKNVDKEFSYHLYELIPFLIIGVLGGFAGALFTFINVKVTEFRREKINKVKSIRVLEVFLIIGLSTFLQFFVPLLFSCREKPENLAEELEELKQFNCPEGHYNPMASIMFAPYEQSIFNLFKFNKEGFDYVHMFGLPALFGFFVFYLLFAAYTAGSGISSGTFVPMIVIGAAYGRGVGVIMATIAKGSSIDPGVYAIMGAAAFMGGVSRLTISLTVILIEITNQLQYLLPIMITVMTAKWVADACIHPLFDILMQMKYIPYLEPHPSKEMKLMMCKHIMAKKPVYLCETTTIGDILRVLKETRHNGFPVVNNHDDRNVKGLILRTQLLMILERVADVYIPNSETVYSHLEYTTKLTWKLPSVNDFSFDPADYEQEVDLTEVMNITVINVNVEFAVSEAFHLFRTMGLRHMVVVSETNKLKGIITKKDLLEKTCEQRYRELSHMKLGIDQLLHVGDDN